MVAGWLGSIGSNVYSLLLYAILAVFFYYLFPITMRPAILLLESLIFYYLCDARFLLLVVLETLFTWWIGLRLGLCCEQGRCRKDAATRMGRTAKFWLVAGIAIVLAILCFFKYEHFFVSSVGFSAINIVMPLGISYYSFREISYLADIYMGKRLAEQSFLCYANYVLFFPQMLSGPIARSEQFMPMGKRVDAVEQPSCMMLDGIYLIISGLFKKVVIADRISPYVTSVFSSYRSYPSLALWLALFLNAVYIYCDFAGYSEIAIGITNLYGIPCKANFLRPYLATSMKEFWRRWHISLSSWLKDYVYIPLGGNRAGRLRTKCNVLAVFLLCGMWHGNTWTYLVWGIYHWIFNVLSRKKRSKLGSICGVLRVLFLSMVGWLIFRSESLTMVGEYLVRLIHGFALNYNSIVASVLPFTGDNTCVAYLLTSFIMMACLAYMEAEDEWQQDRAVRRKGLRTSVMLLLILLFGIVGSGSFLYANY